MASWRFLNVCRTLTQGAGQSYSDTFSGAAMSADWMNPGWTLAGNVGLPLVSDGFARTNASAAREGRIAILSDQMIATKNYREVAIAWRTKDFIRPEGVHAYLFLDLPTALPDPVTGGAGFMLVAQSNGASRSFLLLYKDGVQVASREFATGVPLGSGGDTNYILRLSIDAQNHVRGYWPSSSTPSVTYQPTSYSTAVSRVGFGIRKNNVAHDGLVDWFKLTHFSSAGGLPPQMLVGSKNGLFFYQSLDGTMIQLDTMLTLASDRWLSSVPYLQKLFIADYGLKHRHTAGGGSTALAVGVSTLTAPSGTDFNADGVNDLDDMVDITAGTWGSSTTIGLGTYPIVSHTATTIVVTGPFPAAAGTGVNYRVIRAPKVFDSSTLTLTRHTTEAKPSGGNRGFVPPGCTIVAAYRARLVWTGDPDNDHRAFMSAVGNPRDHEYFNDVVDAAFAYDPARFVGAAEIGDAVTAAISHSDDYILFCGKRSVTIQRGDPSWGGALDSLSRELGIVSQSCFCYTPEGYVAALTQDGIYLFSPSPDATPQKISRELLPEELSNLNVDDVDVFLAYDVAREGINIFVTPKTPGSTNHYWFGWRTKSLHREGYPVDMEPTAAVTHSMAGKGSPQTILGSRDGYLRMYSDAMPNDDGLNFVSYILIGPIPLGGGGYGDGILREVIGQLAKLSGPATLEIQVGDSIEAAYQAAPRDAFALVGGKNLTHSPRLRGSACFLRLSSEGGVAWAHEQMSIARERLGKQRLLKVGDT
jgi:hypothetical protein